ncbi:MAG: serine hydrolase, partial [Bacteroidota bacterium]
MGCLSPAFAQEDQTTSSPEVTAVEDTLSFWDLPDLNPAYITTQPEVRQDGIPVGELGLGAESKAEILALAQAIADSAHGNYDALLIAQNGRLLFESYYRKGRVDRAHGQASATKGYTTLAVGRAIQLGYLTMADLNKPLVNFLTELDPTRWAEGIEHITLHKAMTMHSGIRIPEEVRETMVEDPSQVQGQALMQAWFEHTEPITPESQTWKYSWDPDMVMQVIEAVVPGGAEAFIKQQLLDKLGITNYTWQNSVSGVPEAGWRVSMTSRDMLKWGTLVLNGGQWRGEQLIPE